MKIHKKGKKRQLIKEVYLDKVPDMAGPSPFKQDGTRKPEEFMIRLPAKVPGDKDQYMKMKFKPWETPKAYLKASYRYFRCKVRDDSENEDLEKYVNQSDAMNDPFLQGTNSDDFKSWGTEDDEGDFFYVKAPAAWDIERLHDKIDDFVRDEYGEGTAYDFLGSIIPSMAKEKNEWMPPSF